MALIPGTAGNDTLVGTVDDDEILGFDGNDTLSGDQGDDILRGGNDKDDLNGQLGADFIQGGFGGDTVYGHDRTPAQKYGKDLSADTFSGTLAEMQGDFIYIGDEALDVLQIMEDVNVYTFSATRSFVGDTFQYDVSVDTDHDDIAEATFTVLTPFEGFTWNNSTPGETNLTFGATAGSDFLFGFDSGMGHDGKDTLNGGDGNDFLDSRGGQDLLRGENGDDALFGGDDIDRLIGGPGSDSLNSGLGNDILEAGTHSAGNPFATDGALDVFSGTAAELDGDVMYGGDNDFLDRVRIIAQVTYQDIVHTHHSSNSSHVFEIDVDGDSIADTQFTFFNPADVWNIRPISNQTDIGFGATSGNDHIIGSTKNDAALNGLDGDDKILGRAGDDMIDGGAGLDLIDQSDATGPLTLNLNLSNVSASGIGTDTYANIEGGIGGDSGDKFFAKNNNDVNEFHGGGGADTISSFGGNDRLFGDGGNDRIFAGEGDDVAEGGDDADTLNGQAGNDALIGGTGNDRLYGGNDDDVLLGGEGADLLVGGTGSDTMDAGAGNDRLFVDASDNPNNVDGGDGSDRLIGQGTGGLSYNLANHNLEGALGTSGNDVFNGSGLALRTVLVGKNGNDNLTGGAGGDLLEGRNDNDQLIGNAGNDFLTGQNGDDNIFGGDGNDTLFGGAGVDRLVGGEGNDFLQGDGGADSLDGEGGDDDIRIDSADNPSFIFGRSGYDTVRLLGSDAYDFAFGAQGFERAFGNNEANALDGSGSTSGVTIFGLGGNDTLTGSLFDDTLNAADGDDVVHLLAGDDSAHGGNGSDTAVFAGNQADYSVNIVNPGVSAKITHIATGDLNSLSFFEFATFDDGTIAI